jgi:hypothetical protein
MDLEFVCGEQGLWADIMRNEYLRSKDLLVDEHRNMSQFCNAIQKVKLVFYLRAKHQVRNGSSTRLWFDWWQGSGPSKERFPSLFALAVEQDCSIARANVDGTWWIPLHQALGQEDLAAWGEFRREIGVFHLSTYPDIISWALEPSGCSLSVPCTKRFARGLHGNIIIRCGTSMCPSRSECSCGSFPEA